MKIFNTTSCPLVKLFNEIAAKGMIAPTQSAKNLFTKMSSHLRTLVVDFSMPSIQFFGAPSFEYYGRHFSADATWTEPEGAIDGVQASFLIEENGQGFQYILFDHKQGTICEGYVPAHLVDTFLPALVIDARNYLVAHGLSQILGVP